MIHREQEKRIINQTSGSWAAIQEKLARDNIKLFLI